MKISELYLKILTTNAWKELVVIKSLFAIMEDEKPAPYHVVRREDGHYYNDPDLGYTKIEDALDTKNAILHPLMNFVVPANAWIGVGAEPIKTVCGNAMVMRAMQDVVQDRMSFITNKMSASQLEKIVSNLIKDDADIIASDEVAAKYISATSAPKLFDTIYTFTSLMHLCVPAFSEKTILPPEGIFEYKEKLFKEHEGKLDDPAVIAKINKLLIEFMLEAYKGDPAMGFMISGKTINVAMAKKFLMYGGVGAFRTDGKMSLIKESLYEGVSTEHFAEFMNAAREGSFKRGAETALGGEWTKYVYRMTQNILITDRDCGSTETKVDVMQSGEGNFYNGLYFMDGKLPKMITDENFKSLVGKPIQLRTPLRCLETVPNICGVCAGESARTRPESTPTETSNVGSTFMGLAMGAMHGKELKTNRLSMIHCH